MEHKSLHHPTSSAPARFCTRREAADLLSLSPRQLSNLVLAGELPVARFGGVLRFRREDLEAFIAAHTGFVARGEGADAGDITAWLDESEVEGGAH